MAGEYRLDFTYEAWSGCRDKPSVRLVSALMDAKPGDRIVIVGEDAVMPFTLLIDTLEDEGFEYEVEERDDLIGTYKIVATKKG